MGERIEVVKEAIGVLVRLRSSVQYLETTNENKHFFSAVPAEIKKAEDHLHNILLKGEMNKQKLQEALAHLNNIKALLRRLFEISTQKTGVLRQEVDTYKQNAGVLATLLTEVTKVKNDFDQHVANFNTYAQGITDIKEHVHSLARLQAIIDKETEDIVSLAEQNITDTNSMQHEVTALTHLINQWKQANDKLIGSGNPPDADTVAAFEDILRDVKALEAAIRTTRVTAMQSTRQAYYGQLKQYHKERTAETHIEQHFNSVKKVVGLYLDPQRVQEKGIHKHNLETRLFGFLIGAITEEINAQNALTQSLNQTGDLDTQALAAEEQAIHTLLDGLITKLTNFINAV